MKKQADYRENLRQLREDIDWKILGSHMQEARKQSKFTQAQMAERMGISPNYYSGYESGDKHINLSLTITVLIRPASMSASICIKPGRLKFVPV